jgi:uncharacterized membrane protein
MDKGRLEAFSDGVLAIVLTIMVLELKAPQDASLDAIRAVAPLFLSYLLSFIYIAIYWNNHHHLLQAAVRVSGRVLWANMHLLFWLSLIPVVTHWIGNSHFAPFAVAVYAVILLLAGCAYYLLTRALIAEHGLDSPLAVAVGRDRKGIMSLVIYAAAVPIAFLEPLASCGLFVVVAIIWLVPDRRIETVLADRPADDPGANCG